MGLFSEVETSKIGENTSGGTRRILDTDTYLVTVSGIIDLGTQHIEYQGDERDEYRKRIVMEVVDEHNEDGSVVTTHLDVKDSVHEKSTMTKILLACSRGDKTKTYGELLDGAIGKSFRVQIARKESRAGREYNRAVPSTICALSKREEDVAISNEPVIFSLKAPSVDTFKTLTKYTIKVIMDSPEGNDLGKEFHDHYLELFKDEEKQEKDTSVLE